METHTQDLIREAEAAALVGLAPKSLANMRSRGGGPPYIRLSRTAIRYSRRALTDWLKERTVHPGGAA